MKKFLPYIITIAVVVLLAGGAALYLNAHGGKSAKLITSAIQTAQNQAQQSAQNAAAPSPTPTSVTKSSGQTPAQLQPQTAQQLKLHDYGAAPDFTGIDNWINSAPLHISDLKGKVVLVDFWTYSCINCIRTLPYVTKWYDTYKNDGLVVIGVHTPEFSFEKDSANVTDATKRFGIHYPVAQDNEYGTWQAYNNQYWPAEYLIDKTGHIVEENFGEGDYDVTERNIQGLLGTNQNLTANSGPDLSGIGSPEMYFEPSRLQYLTPNQSPSDSEQNYSYPSGDPLLNIFALAGHWKFVSDGAVTTETDGKIKLKFHSAKIFMVAQSASAQAVLVTVDGKPQSSVMVQMSQLYTLFDSNDYTDHVIEITIPQSGFEIFTFTFG